MAKKMKREVYLNEYEIDLRTREIAKEIELSHPFSDRVILVGVLRGAFMFLSDLSKRLNIQHQVDFVSIGSYDKDESGDVKLLLDTRENVRGRHVIIVEDIVDSGKTINFLRNLFLEKGAKTVETCSLLKKKEPKEEYPIDYVGFEVPQEPWYVGGGLDFDNKYRTLPHIDILIRK